MSKRLRFAGVNFDHMHMGDLLRQVHEHPDCDIVGVADQDPARMRNTIDTFAIAEASVFEDFTRCLRETRPDVAIVCAKTGEHADYVEAVMALGCHVLLEKPFAASLADADRMIAAAQKSGKTLLINWPLAWYPPHLTSKRLIDQGVIGEVAEVHYYDGNRGPLRHLADKAEVSEEEAARLKGESWWYQRRAGGGSLLDYLGYGVTLGTWFHGNEAPLEVTAMTDQSAGLEVDEHSVTVARYKSGLSKFETRWGTFSDPWITQPQPKCGFNIVGTRGTIASYDYESVVRLQTSEKPQAHEVPVDEQPAHMKGPVAHLVHHFETGAPLHGPLRPDVCRIGQRIVDSAMLSARAKRTVELLG